MRLPVLTAFMICWGLLGSAAAADPKLDSVKAIPDGLNKDVAAMVSPQGHRVVVDGGAVCSVWFVKELPLKDKFKPSLSVKYPFVPGELLGVLQIETKSKFTDFRGQEMKAGVFTLRYGQQPEDGNHVGTSDLSDFLLAIPAAADSDPKPIKLLDSLTKSSAKASGSTHPAIFSLLPADKVPEAATLTHDGEKHHTILTAALNGKGLEKKIPLRMIVIGKSDH